MNVHSCYKLLRKVTKRTNNGGFMMTKLEFDRQFLVDLKKVRNRAEGYNISDQEALSQICAEAYELYKDEEFNKEFDAEVNS